MSPVQKISDVERVVVLERIMGGAHIPLLADELGVSAQLLYMWRSRERKRVGWVPELDPQALSDAYCQASQCDRRISNGRLSRGSVTCSKVCRDRLRSQGKSVLRGKNRVAKVAHRRAVQASLAPEPVDGVKTRRGSTYRSIVGNPGWVRLLLEGGVTHEYIAEQLGCSQAAVSRSVKALIEDAALAEAKAAWVPLAADAALLPVAEVEELRGLGRDVWGDGQEALMRVLEDAFWEYEHRFFTIGSRQDKFIVKPFHREVVYELIYTFVFATQVLILTPPRHGKSEVLLRFAHWILVMYPNLQILWVAANLDLANQMTTKLKGVFEYNEELKEAFLPPGERFGDDRAPRWREDSFTLYTRTDHTLKSPSFTALGSSATVAGRDVDYGFIDDLEERKTVATPELRRKSRQKHSEIMERKEMHTGMATIASRQHLDDIPHHLMQEEGEDAWKVLVYPAHDEAVCESDPEEYEAHVDCMLMPEIRDYRWLMKMRTEAEALGLPGRFPLRYLQKPVPIEGIVFDIPLIKDKCYDRSRGLGLDGLPAMNLIAGLDPAARGQQVAFLWAWDGTTLHMVDFERIQAGGVLGAAKVMRDWAKPYDEGGYDLTDWIHEDNSGQIDAWKHVPAYRDVITEFNLNVKPHTTGKNKHDAESGISAMATWYHKGLISLPYGTPTARRKVRQLISELELWTTDGLSKHGKTDIKMAHWLPFPRILKWGQQARNVSVQETGDSGYPDHGFVKTPWVDTPYPGR